MFFKVLNFIIKFELNKLIFLILDKVELSIDVRDTLAVTKIATACEEAVETGKYVLLDWSHDE